MVLGIDVNLWAVLITAIVSMIVGALWYGPLFGKAWMRFVGFNKDSVKKMKMTATKSMTLGFIGSLIMAYVLAVFVGLSGANTLVEGAMVGFWVWLGFAMPINASVFLWEGKSIKLFFLNTFQYLIKLKLMAAILAVW